ncbi:MAG: serine/threonine-protein phosphatase [Thermoflexaceae bacterium]|nr:serine/threonine-protein phosphatase [Thermoflexaceae bacterium]
MNYIAAAVSDMGSKREINQDALMIKNRITHLGNVCLCVICDGMGGLAQGEVASTHVIKRISDWFLYRAGGIRRFDKMIFCLERELQDISMEILEYGRKQGFAVGTTATILLVAGRQYAIIHVGDTRVYRISKGLSVHIRQMTKDQSVNDYMLTQSVGTGTRIVPEIIRGRTEKNEIFLLCTDGFRHKNQPSHLKKGFNPQEIKETADLERKLRIYVDRARKLGETDDITALAMKLI